MVILSPAGLRGVVGNDLRPSHIMKYVGAFANFTKKGSYVVGRDTRPSSHWLSRLVLASFLSQGCRVYDLGEASTPALHRAVAVGGFDGGIEVTASHNPPEWNGLKFVMRKGRSIWEEELVKLIEARTRSQEEWRGYYSSLPNDFYVKDLISYLGKEGCNGVKVALDLGGGVASLFAHKVFEGLGCKTITVHSTPSIFGRGVDPVYDQLSELSRLIIKEGCDAGFAYDSDADRLVVTDEQGERLSPDDTFLLCIRYFLELRSLSRVVVSVDTSLAAEEMVRSAGGEVYRSKVGESNVVKKMLESNSAIGGEGSSGGFIDSGWVLCRDGMLASILVTKLIKEFGPLKKITKELPRYHRIRQKIHISKGRAEQLLNEIFLEHKNADRTDGIRIDFSDSSWVLIRPSRTEPSLRISVEAKDKSRAEELMSRYLRRVKRSYEDEGAPR